MINNCSFKQADITLFPVKKMDDVLNVLGFRNKESLLASGEIPVGCVLLPLAVAHRLTILNRDGMPLYQQHPVAFSFFTSDYYFSDCDPLTPLYINRYQEEIIAQCLTGEKPTLWVFGYTPLLRCLRRNLLEAGALVHYYTPHEQDKLFLIKEKEIDEKTVYTTRLIQDKEWMIQN